MLANIGPDAAEFWGELGWVLSELGQIFRRPTIQKLSEAPDVIECPEEQAEVSGDGWTAAALGGPRRRGKKRQRVAQTEPGSTSTRATTSMIICEAWRWSRSLSLQTTGRGFVCSTQLVVEALIYLENVVA